MAANLERIAGQENISPYSRMGYQAQFLRDPRTLESLRKRYGGGNLADHVTSGFPENTRAFPSEDIGSLARGGWLAGTSSREGNKDPVTVESRNIPGIVQEPGTVHLYGRGGNTQHVLAHELGHQRLKQSEGGQRKLDAVLAPDLASLGNAMQSGPHEALVRALEYNNRRNRAESMNRSGLPTGAEFFSPQNHYRQWRMQTPTPMKLPVSQQEFVDDIEKNSYMANLLRLR